MLPPILLVDAATEDAELATLVLRGAFGDLAIEHAGDAAALTRLLTSQRYGLAIVEHQLPFITGSALVDLVRDLQPGCPIVVLTDAPPAVVASEILPSGIDAVALKSRSGLARLPETVRTVLMRSRRRQLGAGTDPVYRRLVDGLPIGVFIAGLDGAVRDANPALAALLGYARPEQLAYRSIPGMLRRAADRELWRTGIEGSGTVADLEAEVERGDGSTTWIRLSAWTVADRPDGERLVHGLVADVSRSRATEAELERRSREVEQSNTEQQEMAFVISHDLRQPVNVVRRSLAVLTNELADDALPTDARQLLEMARRGADALDRMLGGILRYSRIETDAAPFAVVDLERVLDRVLDLLGDELASSGAAIRRETLPEVWGDETQVEQLLTNLIGNAIKFRSECGPEIHISAAPDGDRWRISIRDNGIGIEPGAADRVFSMFQRLHTADEIPGTGIGLAICRRIVRRHGGRIWFDSSPGAGATFHLTLPRPLVAVASLRHGGRHDR